MITITWDNVADIAAKTMALSQKVGTHHAYDWAEDVAEAGKETIEAIARIDTGWMKSSVGKMVTAMGGVGVAEAGYGLVQAHPYYTKFQEYGTRKGIQPMASLPAGGKAMETSADNSGMKMLLNINRDWEAI